MIIFGLRRPVLSECRFSRHSGSAELKQCLCAVDRSQFSCYFLFGSIFVTEDKYKGNRYLKAFPYKRRNMVEAKYLLAVLMCLCSLICCQIMSFAKIQEIVLTKYKLTFSDAAIVFLSYQWSGVYFFTVLLLIVWKDKGCADCENAYSANMCTDRTGSPDGIGYNL